MRKHFNKAIARLTLLGSIGISFVAHAGSNLVISGDTVYDKKTDLTWARCSVGLRWNSATNYCVGLKKRMKFDEAKKMVFSNGWRLPTMNELLTLVEKPSGANNLHIDFNAFPDTADVPTTKYWSSTETSDAIGYYVNFSDGKDGDDYVRGFALAVRLVRGGQ